MWRHQRQVAGQVPALRSLEHPGGKCRRRSRRGAAQPILGLGPARGRAGAGRHRAQRNRAHAQRHRRTRSCAGWGHGGRGRGADRRRSGHRQVHLAAAGAGRLAATGPGRVVCDRRGIGRTGGLARATPGPGSVTAQGAGRNRTGEDPASDRCRAAGAGGDRFDPDGLFQSDVLRARIGCAGARMRGPSHPHRQIACHRGGAGGACHQGRLVGGPARAGAHGGCGAVFRG